MKEVDRAIRENGSGFKIYQVNGRFKIELYAPRPSSPGLEIASIEVSRFGLDLLNEAIGRIAEEAEACPR
ncbi:hypothetical protein ABH19_11430 [Leptospirillum sp. Group II 'CF-1']|jgi:hypothetical protein|uniref:hypothetical protein n=1 Tax=Leptospirillum sp. Group II 'CF-1' TaxID=1660083 RepID=UPI0000F0C7E3|nr:hypothetical protein [Leptospirillum sp. Group II 'CF-1']AKS24222.1 hypothetical protein ABH19_11430 [Leptospirillum sp. Group II 'CF-1']EAY56566.1 MAG: hypothetical protein UBAL2_80620213 [Leptospirillum rubarum]